MKVLMFLLFLTISIGSYCQDPNFHIYLSFGQSNMAGAGDIESQDLSVNSRFQFMKPQDCASKGQYAGNWYTAVPPLWGCTGGIGPSDYFGRTLVANLATNVKVGVVVVAVPGCKIELFGKTGYEGLDTYNNVPSKYAGSAYAWLLDLAKKAQTTGVIKGFLLHQGESNSGDQNWPAKVKGVYDNLIKDLNLNPAQTPLLAGELLYQNYGSCCSGHNAIIAKLPSVLPNSHVISASGLPGKDVYHFNSAGNRTFGQRYAEKMLTLLPKTTLPTVSIITPTNTTVHTAPATVSITAVATVSTGSIANVKFYNGATLLFTDNTSPYSFSWTGVVEGVYSVRAVATDNMGASAFDTVSVKVNVPQGPYNGTALTIPGIIQAEFFDVGGNNVAYFDDSPGSAVTPVINFRTNENVDIETCTDAGGGYNLGYAIANEWLEYTVIVAATGTYKLDLRVACNGEGRTIALTMDGSSVANNIAIPNTAGWQTWTTVTVNNVALTSGQHVMRLTIGATSYVNINYLTFNSIVTSLENDVENLGKMVYPNPFKDHLYLETKGRFYYQLTNMEGLVLEEGMSEAKIDFVNQYPKGIYLIRVQQGEKVQVLKLMKE